MKKIIIGFFIFCFLFIILAALLPGSRHALPSLPFVPTPTPVSFSQEQTPPPQLSSLEKFQLGPTTKDAIQKMNGTVATTSAGNEITYSLPSVNPLIPDEIVTDNTGVIFERTSTFTNDPGGLPSLSSYLKKYGTPQQVIEGNSTYYPTGSSYLYPTRGVVFIGNPLTDETYEIQRFFPMSLPDYLKKYGSTVAVINEQEQIVSQ